MRYCATVLFEDRRVPSLLFGLVIRKTSKVTMGRSATVLFEDRHVSSFLSGVVIREIL